MTMDINNVETIIDRHGMDEKALIQAMLAVQEEFHYLPVEALNLISEKLNVPMIRIYQVAAFYKVFSLDPRGKHIITVCKGTACHVRGSNMLVDQVNRVLKIDSGETTEDLQFTLEEVNCLGCCAIGPVMTVDNKYYGNMSVSKVERVINKYVEKEVVADD
jgi:NADH-quinone oxidoreductase subunit E